MNLNDETDKMDIKWLAITFSFSSVVHLALLG